jgi:hypothetical protein
MDRHKALVQWFKDAYAAGAHNREDQDAAVSDRVKRAGSSLGWEERISARQAAGVAGKSGPKPKG